MNKFLYIMYYQFLTLSSSESKLEIPEDALDESLGERLFGDRVVWVN